MPIRVNAFDKIDFPLTSLSFDLFFSKNSGFYSFMNFIVDKAVNFPYFLVKPSAIFVLCCHMRLIRFDVTPV